KPKTGMYQQIARRLSVRLEGVYMVGDRLTDVEASRAIRARPVLVRTGRGAEAIASADDLTGVEIQDSLADFVDALLSEARPGLI
ncbi:MAG: HAD hydrolase-like protein, partial [Woeseiaceae bacterium]